MHLIDIGANLTHDSFDRDRDAVLDRARQAGVVQMVITGASREHSPLAVQLAQQHPGFLYATAGVHPHHAVEYTDECDAEMRALHAHPEVVAVGSVGWTTSVISRRARPSTVRSSASCSWPRTMASRCSCTSATRMPISWHR